MFYVKNLSRWKRLVRVIAGVLMLGCGLIGLKGLPLGYLIAGAGGITAMTGFIGFCPMCSLAGLRLKNK